METVWQVFYWIGISTTAICVVVTSVLITIALCQAIRVLNLIIREKQSPQIAAIIDSETAEERDTLSEALQKLLKQFEKWEGYHQWDEEDEAALEDGRAVLAKAETNNTQTKG